MKIVRATKRKWKILQRITIWLKKTTNYSGLYFCNKVLVKNNVYILSFKQNIYIFKISACVPASVSWRCWALFSSCWSQWDIPTGFGDLFILTVKSWVWWLQSLNIDNATEKINWIDLGLSNQCLMGFLLVEFFFLTQSCVWAHILNMTHSLSALFWVLSFHGIKSSVNM